MNILSNIKTRTKLIGGFLILASLVMLVAVVSYFNLKSIKDSMDLLYTSNTLPISSLGNARAAFFGIRGDIFKYTVAVEERPVIRQSIDDRKKTITEELDKFRTKNLIDEEKVALAEFDKNISAYYSALDTIITESDRGDETSAIANIGVDSKAVLTGNIARDTLEKLITINTKLAADQDKQGDETFNGCVRTLIILVIICLVLAVGLGLLISNNITVPLNILMGAIIKISNGDLIRDMNQKSRDIVVNRNDEIGEIGKSFIRLTSYLQSMGDIARNIAINDLSRDVKPNSEKDELGISFVEMINGLRSSIGMINDGAENLAAASEQLASAANQAGLATNQISTTVQQVAKGTADQATSVSTTASSIDQMAKAIEGVAKGAQEQSKAISKAAEVTAQINIAIQQVASNAASVSRESAAATEAAHSGAAMVEETLKGMQSIKTKVGASAEKVQEMGKRSEEIGAIVETIEDIASQTNLLALNAAIEAARAGEHGKGFAVVADEVRKLAERSSNATKEIGGLISGIQKTVTEAVKAMDEGSMEVELGVASANKSGSALSDILTASKAVNLQAIESGKAAEMMSFSAAELVTAVDSVSAVVEENTASTEEMAANSTEVTQSIESIASVSEENSAAIEQVSASAEEMSAQVEEVTASAQSLAELAQSLQKVVNRFKLSAV